MRAHYLGFGVLADANAFLRCPSYLYRYGYMYTLASASLYIPGKSAGCHKLYLGGLSTNGFVDDSGKKTTLPGTLQASPYLFIYV